MSDGSGWLLVEDGGGLTTVQDAGRGGLAHLGVSPSGFLDAPAARLANRLLGNLEDMAVLETTGRGPRLRIAQAPAGSAGVIVAVTGAPAAVTVDGRAADQNAPLLLRAGQVLEVGRATAGVRSYVAVRGGLTVAPVLGSRSTDLLSGLGPPVVQPGHRLPFGPALSPVPAADFVAVSGIATAPVIGVYPGPSAHWFDDSALTALTEDRWTVSPDSSRVGVRLTGPVLRRAHGLELPPEGMVTGALQVPPNGQPVLLLADRPTTGGYPVIAVARESDLPHAAQAAPGTVLRFRLLSYPR